MQLAIENVSKRYGGGNWALRNFTLQLGPGVLGLLGPNGAGKTTLMSILATITRATEGRVVWNGTDLATNPDALRSTLGYLPQDFGVYPNLNAVEFLEYLAAVKGLDAAASKKRIDELLDLVNLTDVRKRPLGGYSGGMKQRVGIAQALLNDPQLLIVDEPTAGLDPEERVRFRNLLSELSGERIVILSTHIVSDVEATATDIALISQGTLVAHASPEELLRKVEGKVWEWVLPSAELNAARQRYLISNTARRSDGVHARVLSDAAPDRRSARHAQSRRRVSLLPVAAPRRSGSMNREPPASCTTWSAPISWSASVATVFWLLSPRRCSLPMRVAAEKVWIVVGNGYRGVYNSAWIGVLMTVCCSTFLSLVGFYIVKNSVQRDTDTRVGQILAATPMRKDFYTVAKTLSNFAVLACMVVVLMLAAVVMQLVPRRSPFFLSVEIVGAVPFLRAAHDASRRLSVALLFETLPVLRGGVGNVVVFFLVDCGARPGCNRPRRSQRVATALSQHAQAPCGLSIPADPDNFHFSLTIGGERAVRTFPWNGIDWTTHVLLMRLLWIAVAAGSRCWPLYSFIASILRDPGAGSGRRPHPASPNHRPRNARPLRSAQYQLRRRISLRLLTLPRTRAFCSWWFPSFA